MAIYGKRRWLRRLTGPSRRAYRYWVLLFVGVLMVVGAGTALAAIVLRGEGTVTAPAYRQRDLAVSKERLSGPLVPGGAADLLFMVHNPNPFPAVVNRVSLASVLRKAKPAGCSAKVSGPLTRPGGYSLPAADQVTVPAGRGLEVTVRAAFRLAGSARAGCGFTVDILVNATQAAGTPAATLIPPKAPTSAPPTLPTTPPATVPATTAPPDAPVDEESSDIVPPPHQVPAHPGA